jgi:hypothetical protein
MKNNEIFEKSRFFSSYGNKLEKYEFYTHIIYIAPDEFEKMRAYLRTRMRDIKDVSPSNVYYSNCMTFYPIESEIKREEEIIKRAEKNLKNLEDALERVMRDVDCLN